MVVLNGSCRLHVGDAVHDLHSGDACHFSAADPHHLSRTSPDLTVCVVLSEE